MSSGAPAVTVIIATYNNSNVLRYAIDSVLWQTFEDFELWVIGDGCTDDSAAVVASYEDRRVHWLNLPENSGYQSAPNNEGLRRARGRYVAYLNHDDLWLPNHLQVLVDRLEETGADFAYSILEFVSPDGGRKAEIARYPYAPCPPHASATLHRRNVVDHVGFWKAPGDTAQFPRVAFFRDAELLGKRFVLAPQLTVLMFLRGGVGEYGRVGLQPEFMNWIRQDPGFVARELGTLLVQAYHEMERPTGLRRWGEQVNLALARALLGRGINPASLRFWIKPGRRISEWRKGHGLDVL